MAASRFATFLESFDADPKTRGTQWEHVCKWFLETDPVYCNQLKKVWLWAKWPGRWGSIFRWSEARGGATPVAR
jgi:predicted helicase